MPLSNRINALALLIYIPLATVAVGWAWFGHGRWAWSLAAPILSIPYAFRVLISLGLGATLAVAVIATTPMLVERARWARVLGEEIKPIIDPLSPIEVTFLALASGFAEELFFRGAMQPVFGLLLASLIFGVVHTGPKRIFLAWSVWAFAMGLLFGLIFELTGVLWGPILAHVLINQRNMTYMKRH